MGSYIKTYMRSVDKALEDESTDFAALKREHLVQIEFIQHERLIHLMVTIMCCILLLLILDFSYLIYYFFIENSTQQLYRQYNKICAKLEPDNKTVTELLTDKKMT